MSNLSVALLGAFKATLAERPLPPLRTKSVQALLIYLLCHADQPHQREALMTLLWPDLPVLSAQASMRQTLYRLRKLIPEVQRKSDDRPVLSGVEVTVPFLLVNRQAIQINPDADYFLDVDVFNKSDPTQAIALYRGDFLADFYLPDSEAFEEWAANRRAHYRRRVLEVMERETAVHIQNANYDEAIKLTQRQLEIDNLRENSHRQLMEAWARNGRRQDALAHYDYLCQLLQDELAIAPEAETTALIEAIRAGALSRTTTPAAAEAILLDTIPRPPRHNLPQPTTLFIGRERELAHIADQLADPACRLLTILGAGGMGKTRLGIEAAQAQVEHFADGIVYVSLAPIGNDDQGTATSAPLSTGVALNPLVSALADALKIPFQGSDPLEKQLINYLRRKEMLIVFDNFEHLLTTAVFLPDLLSQAPNIKILTTSRERLNLQEEWLFVLQGLSFANEEGAVTSDELSAVQLFSQRARQVKADFDWAAEESAVLRICQLVEGMPLGLELASAWVIQLSCQEIAAEIKAGLDFLTTEMRNVPDRHRSIRAIFGHSWQMLTAKEKDVLRKLSVFRGGFDRKAAQAVAGASLPTLARLVGKSLLSVRENGRFGKLSVPRYAIHELLRQFAAAKLAQTEADALEAGYLHCCYFLTLLAEQEPKIRGPQFLDMLAVIERDLDNVRTAVQWGINHQPHLFNQAIGIVLWFFYDARALYLEGEVIFGLLAALIRRALNLNQPDIESGVILPEFILWAQYNTAWGGMTMLLGRPLEAEPLLKKSLLVLPAHDLDAHWARAYCLAILGVTAFYNGDLPQAISYLEESGAFFQATKDMWMFASVLWFQGQVELALGDMDEAQRLMEESERRLSQMRDEKYIGAVLDQLARLALYRGDIAKAETYGQTALTQQTRVGSISDITESLNYLGEIAYLKGDYRKAQAYHERCLQMVTEINMSTRVHRSLWNLGNLAVAEGDFQLAKHYFTQADFTTNVNQGLIGGPGWAALGLGELAEAKRFFQAGLQAMLKSGVQQVGLDALAGMAQLKLRDNQFKYALELLALVRYYPVTNWEVQEKVRKLWQELVAELPPDLIAEAEARGRELDLRQTAESLLAEGNDD